MASIVPETKQLLKKEKEIKMKARVLENGTAGKQFSCESASFTFREVICAKVNGE